MLINEFIPNSNYPIFRCKQKEKPKLFKHLIYFISRSLHFWPNFRNHMENSVEDTTNFPVFFLGVTFTHEILVQYCEGDCKCRLNYSRQNLDM